MFSTPHSCGVVEHSFKQKTGSTPACRWCSNLDALSSSHLEITGTRGLVLLLDLEQPALWANFFAHFPSIAKLLLMQNNQLLHSVTNDLCLSNSNSSLIK